MKALIVVMVSFSAVAVHAASPLLSDVNVRQDASRLVTISYTVDQDCIVTVDVTTNGVSIGEENFTNMTGMVNRKVAAGANTICWKPAKSWPNQRIAAGDISVEVKAWPLCSPPPYMVVDLVRTGDGYLNDGEFVHYFASTNAFPGGFENRIYKTDTIVMRHIPAAGVMWKMGTTDADAAAMGSAATAAAFSGVSFTRAEYEKCHYVMLTNDYWFAIYPTTQGQCKLINNGSYGYSKFTGASGTFYDRATGAFVATTDRDILPQGDRSYEDIRGSISSDGVNWPTTGYEKTGGLIKKLRDKTGLMFDLPTEAQWEFACRAGEGAMLYDGNPAYVDGSANNKNGSRLGWLYYNYDLSETYIGNGTNTCYVGRFKPNNWGIYDLIGNVNELCLDYAPDEYSPANLEIDPRGADSDSSNRRIIRGASTANNVAHSRSSWRNRMSATYRDEWRGFRLTLIIRP